MNEYEMYLAERLRQFEAACEQSIQAYRALLQKEQNKRLNEHIVQAQIKMGKNKDYYVQRYRENMAELAQMRKMDPTGLYKTLYDRLEQSHKKGLEIGLEAARKVWTTLIEYLKSQMQ